MKNFRLKTSNTAETAPAVKQQVSSVFNDSENDSEEEDLLRGRASRSWFEVVASQEFLVPCSAVSSVLDNESSTCSLDVANDEIKTETSDHSAETKHVKKKMKTAGLIKRKDEFKVSQPPRYMANLIRKATEREMEMEFVKEAQLKAEDGENKEVFVTRAYRKKLEERRDFEQKLLAKDIADAENDPRKKKDLTSFHQYMLSTGLAARTNKKNET